MASRFIRIDIVPPYSVFVGQSIAARESSDKHRICFSSEMSVKGKLLVERFGPLRFRFAIEVEPDGGLAMHTRGWSAFGLPVPSFLGPRIAASEDADGSRFRFNVAVALPLVGLVVGYRGWLELSD